MGDLEAVAHIGRFNEAVTSGDWSAFLATLHPDAVMTFVGPPVGPFVGLQAIADAYATNPPDDTMRILSVREVDDGEVIGFAWSRGGSGTLTLHRAANLITALQIAFT